MSKIAKFHQRYTSLFVYPPLKKEEKNRISFKVPNTSQEQRFVRRLTRRKRKFFGVIQAPATMIMDYNYMVIALKNIKYAKSLKRVMLHLCEEIAFPVIEAWLYTLKRKSIHVLEITLEISDKNRKISNILKALDKLQHVHSIDLTLQVSQNTNYQENLDNFLNAFTAYFEENLFSYQRVSLRLNGILCYKFSEIINSLRNWNPRIRLFFKPEDTKQIIDIKPSKKQYRANLVNISFWNQKIFNPVSLNMFFQNLQMFQNIRNLEIVLNKFELNVERSSTMETFLNKISVINSLQITNYYMSFYKMNFDCLFKQVSSRSSLTRFGIGYVQLNDTIYKILTKNLSNSVSLKDLSLYIDILYLIESQQFDIWENFPRSIQNLQLILTCKSSTLSDNGQIGGADQYFSKVLEYVTKLSELESLSMVIPEIEIALGESLTNFILNTKKMKRLEFDCVHYNVNYMPEHREISAEKGIKMKLQIPGHIARKNKELVDKLIGPGFNIEFFEDPYTHFCQVHEKFFRKCL